MACRSAIPGAGLPASATRDLSAAGELQQQACIYFLRGRGEGMIMGRQVRDQNRLSFFPKHSSRNKVHLSQTHTAPGRPSCCTPCGGGSSSVAGPRVLPEKDAPRAHPVARVQGAQCSPQCAGAGLGRKGGGEGLGGWCICLPKE